MFLILYKTNLCALIFAVNSIGCIFPIKMVHLCPTGSEGASYAMFTTVSNAAGTLSTAISTMMLGIWDVSKETMIAGDLTGLMKLTILSTVIQTSGVVFTFLLPTSKDELMALGSDSSKNKIGGYIFLGLTFFSIAYALFVGVLNIIAPGWAGESRM